MIKKPVLLLAILIVIGLVVIVSYKIQTDPFRNNVSAAGQESALTDDFGPIYTVYQDNCLTCHGRAGQGQSGFPSLQKTRMSVNEIKQIINAGRGDMPAFPHITEPQLSELAEMVKQFSK